MTITRDIGADLNAQAGALETAVFGQYDDLQGKIEEFHAKKCLWVGPEIHDCLGYDDALDLVATSTAYEVWFQRKKECRTAAEIEAIQAEQTEQFSQWLAVAIEDIARRALVWDQKAYREDAA